MRRLAIIIPVLWLLAPPLHALEITGVKVFSPDQLEQLSAQSSSHRLLVTSLWESYIAQGYFDVVFDLKLAADTVVAVTEGHQYELGELSYPGIADSILQPALEEVGKNTSATEEGIAGLLKALADGYAESGHPYPAITADSLNLESLRPELFITVNSGPRVEVAAVSFEGLRVTRPKTLAGCIEIRPGATYSETEVRDSYENLRRLDFVRTTGEPRVIFRPGDRDVTVVFPLREERNFAVDGLGYLTPDNQLAGSITATLRNIFGSGERFQFDWQRANETSSRLLLKSTIPRIFATPLDAGIELQQRDRDSSFISTSARLTFLYHLSYDWSVSTSFGSSKITPEVQQLTDAARVLAVDLRTLYDNRVEKRHPRRGVVVEYSFQSSYRREFPAAGGAVSGYSRRLAGELTFYQSLSRDLVWRQRVAAFQAASDFEPLPIDELIEVGGPESIRGYRDNSFIAKLGALANSEMRWYALENLTLLAFTDNGVIRTEDVELGLTGFGAGILIDTSLGEFRFEAALGEGKSLDQMLVHFGFTGEL